jgi:hypothetical protein
MEITHGLEVFKQEYSEYLGPSFELGTANFDPEYPVPNLRKLVSAVRFALKNIHKRGKKDNPLWDVLGVCFF